LTGSRRRLPIYDATAPIACTLGADEVRGRVEQFERLREHLVRIERTEHGVLLHFPADDQLEGDLRGFSVAEKRCCGFWGFDVETAADALRLRWDVPPAADTLVDRLMAFFEGTEPVSIADLL
jgi:hypothetical protein